MARRDPVKTVKALLIQEIKEEHPNFPLIKRYLDMLQAVMQKEGVLSVDSIDEVVTQRAQLNEGTVGTAFGSNLTTANTGIIMSGDTQGEMQMMGSRDGRMSSRRRRESMEDQQLAAMDQMIARTGVPDRLAALSQIDLDGLFPDEAEREVIRNAMQGEVRNRVAQLPSQGGRVVEPRHDADPEMDGEDDGDEQTEAEANT